jgi:hypothetical protein
LESNPPFNLFINNFDESLRADIDGEIYFVSTAFTENNPLRPPNNRQRQRLYKNTFLALDFTELLPGVRITPPNRVCTKTRQLYPDEIGCYLEFKEGRKPESPGLNLCMTPIYVIYFSITINMVILNC